MDLALLEHHKAMEKLLFNALKTILTEKDDLVYIELRLTAQYLAETNPVIHGWVNKYKDNLTELLPAMKTAHYALAEYVVADRQFHDNRNKCPMDDAV